MALIDPDLIASAIRAARDTALMLSPLALVVVALLLPYVYRVLFLRAKVDKRSYEEGKSKTAPMVRRLRRHLDFAARHWREYVASRRRNLKYRIEVSLLYDFAKAAAAFYASDQWRDHLRRQGVANLVFMDEDKPLRENLERNGFFQSTFFKEGVVNRYLMQPTAGGFGSVRVQGDSALLARATTLFREALEEIEPQFEEGHIYLPFLTLSRWERLRFRIHSMIITRLLSEGMEKALALMLSYGLVALLKGDTASSSAVDFVMDIVALLFMAHVFDSVLKDRCGQFKTDWEDRERYYYRRQMHQFIVGLDSAMAREAAQRDKAAAKVLGIRAKNPRGLKRIVRTLKRASRHPHETSLLLGAAQDVMDYDQADASPIALVLLKELATSYPVAYEKLLNRWRTFRHPWVNADKLVKFLLSDAPLAAVAAKNSRALPDRENPVEWHRAVHALQHDFPADVDEARVAHVVECLALPALTPSQRRALLLAFFLGGLLWRLRQIDPQNPLGRRRDARLYHATLTFTLPALECMQARQAAGECDYGLPPAEFANLMSRIKSALPLPAGHQLRLKLGDGQGVAPALAEIQRAVAVKKHPAMSIHEDLPTRHLREWLDARSGDQRTFGVLAGAIHEATRTGLAAKLNKQARAGTDSLLVEQQAFDLHYNPQRAALLRRQLARRGVDGQPNESVLALLGFWGGEDVKPAPLGQIPIRLTFLDLQPVVDYVLDHRDDYDTLEEITHQALVDFYVAARMAASVHELPDVLTRPAEGDDAGGSIARQMAVIRSLRAKVIVDQEPLFLLLQEAAHQLEIIFDPLHASLDNLLGQAALHGPALVEATRQNLYRRQDAGLALLIPLTCLAERQGAFAGSTDAYWSACEAASDREQFLRQFDVRDQAHADALIRARILLHQFEALRSLVSIHAAGERTAFASFDTLAGDADQLRIGAATVMTMIDQSGLRTDGRFRAVREVLAVAMTRQGYCNRGNLSDLVRVTLKLRDSAGNTMFLTRGTLSPTRTAAVLAPDLHAAVVARKPAGRAARTDV
jgi:hypothetical protein